MKDITHFKIGGVPEHFNLPWHIAINEGHFAKHQLAVSWQDFPGGTGAMTKALRAGDIDIAVLLTEGIIADIVKGNPSTIVQIYIQTPLVWGIYSGGKQAIDTEADLKHQKFAISRMGSGSHLMAYVAAEARGWNPQADMEFEIVGNMTGARAALKENRAQGFMWEKFMTQPLVDSGEFKKVGEFPTPWPCFVVAVRNDVLHQFGPQIGHLLDVIRQVGHTFKNDPETPALIAKRYHLQAEDAATWLSATEWATSEEVPYAMLEKIQGHLLKLGIIDKTIPADELACVTCIDEEE